MSETLETYLKKCEALHGHICAGQVLGVRMAMLGCSLIGIKEPEGGDRKKIIVWVEIDRCMADAVVAVTGVRLGKRTLKFVDYGKVAATFYNTETREAVRIVALDTSRRFADSLFPDIEDRRERQLMAYQTMGDASLFKVEPVTVNYSQYDAPGRPLSRVNCVKCGEGVNDGREVKVESQKVFCQACANGAYYVKDKC